MESASFLALAAWSRVIRDMGSPQRASLALKYKHSKPRLIGWLAVTPVLGVAFRGTAHAHM
jgi:hypothetical protein